MKSPLRTLARRLLQALDLFSSHLLRADSYLQVRGWFRSFREGKAVDASGAALPWMTYAAIEFLEERAGRGLRVFEFGAGGSTLWWAARVHAVVSCELDRGWYQSLSQIAPANVQLVHAEPGVAYAEQVSRWPEKFDLIVIDAEERVACARRAVAALRPGGVIVWDNSEREADAEGYAHLLSLGFKELRFSGMGPINPYGWRTSIFYRAENCLGL